MSELSPTEKKQLKIFEKYSYRLVAAIIILLIIISALIGAALQWFVFGVDDDGNNKTNYYNNELPLDSLLTTTPATTTDASYKDCHPDCGLEDANTALAETKALTNYIATLETGWNCLQTNEVKVNQNNMAVTVTKLEGDTNLCSVALGTEQRLVNDVTYHKIPELHWQQGPYLSFNGSQVIEFERQSLENYLPEQTLSSEVSSYETDFATIYYRDEFKQPSAQDLELFPNAAYSVNRLKGINQDCFAEGLSNAEILGLDCGYTYYILSEGMEYLGTYIRGSEAIVNYTLVSSGETQEITAPRL